MNRETSDNAEEIKREVAPIITTTSVSALRAVEYYKNNEGEYRIIVFFANDIRMNMSVRQANELSNKLAFAIQDIDNVEKGI